MPCFDLHFNFPGLDVTAFSIESNSIAVDAELTSATAACPGCGHESRRMHSRYRRAISDLPSHSRRLVIRLTARRFYCDRRDCARRVFCERLSGLAEPHARASSP